MEREKTTSFPDQPDDWFLFTSPHLLARSTILAWEAIIGLVFSRVVSSYTKQANVT